MQCRTGANYGGRLSGHVVLHLFVVSSLVGFGGGSEGASRPKVRRGSWALVQIQTPQRDAKQDTKMFRQVGVPRG